MIFVQLYLWPIDYVWAFYAMTSKKEINVKIIIIILKCQLTKKDFTIIQGQYKFNKKNEYFIYIYW